MPLHAGHLVIEERQVEASRRSSVRRRDSRLLMSLQRSPGGCAVLRDDDLDAPGVQVLPAGSRDCPVLSSTISARKPTSLSRGSRSSAGARPDHGLEPHVEPEDRAAPTTLSTPISPPISVTICRQIASPKPVPPYFRVVNESAWLKALKMSA